MLSGNLVQKEKFSPYFFFFRGVTDGVNGRYRMMRSLKRQRRLD